MYLKIIAFILLPGILFSQKEFLLARADSFSLHTPYTPPPGDPLSHHTAGYAKIMCSAVFITGLSPDFAKENVGYFTSPYKFRKEVGNPVVDYTNKTVSITLPNGIVRKAIYTGSQGCITYKEGENMLHFTPKSITKNLPDADKTKWPSGNLINPSEYPNDIAKSKIESALDAAFTPAEAMTAAIVITYKGKIIGERYGDGISSTTPLESWSMGKSLSATQMGILMNKGIYSINQNAPIPEWQKKGDPRSKIKIKDLLHMSSGLYCRAPQDPDFDESKGYPDHLYLYTGGINSFEYAAGLPQQFPPNTVGRYRNSDPGLINYLNKLGIQKLGMDYLSFPQRALFDKLGIRTMVMETDPYGNFLTQGYEYASARDWARLGNLYLQDGVWNGQRLLAKGFVKFVSTLAEAWVKDHRPVYGGLFWINGDGKLPIPKESYMMLGAGGQSVTIIPDHDLVVVRLGHFKGSNMADDALNECYKILMEAVPSH